MREVPESIACEWIARDLPCAMIAHTDMICFALYSTQQAMQQAYRPLLDALGLTYPQYLVLNVLWTQGQPRSVGELGSALNLESSTLTPLLKRLETAGLIARRRAKSDERRVDVHLTDAGRDMQQRAEHLPVCIQDRSGLRADDLDTLREQLTVLATNLRQADGNP